MFYLDHIMALRDNFFAKQMTYDELKVIPWGPHCDSIRLMLSVFRSNTNLQRFLDNDKIFSTMFLCVLYNDGAGLTVWSHHILHQINLIPFSTAPQGHPEQVSVSVVKLSYPTITVKFKWKLSSPTIVTSPLNTLKGKKDKIYEGCCAEVFLRFDKHAYFEWNLDLEGHWNAYTFDNYRVPSKTVTKNMIPKSYDLVQKQNEITMVVSLDLAAVAKSAPQLSPPSIEGHFTSVWRSAQDMSYWAHRHPQAKPDFHDPTLFMQIPS